MAVRGLEVISIECYHFVRGKLRSRKEEKLI